MLFSEEHKQAYASLTKWGKTDQQMIDSVIKQCFCTWQTLTAHSLRQNSNLI